MYLYVSSTRLVIFNWVEISPFGIQVYLLMYCTALSKNCTLSKTFNLNIIMYCNILCECNFNTESYQKKSLNLTVLENKLGKIVWEMECWDISAGQTVTTGTLLITVLHNFN